MTIPISPLMVGSGTASASAEAIDLMELATRRALSVAGITDTPLDAIIVPAGTWPYGDPGRELARRLGSPSAHTILGQLGISQQELINVGLGMIARGTVGSVLVVGGESRRWAATGAFSDLPGPPDQTLERSDAFLDDLEIASGLVFPAVRSYALIERAVDSRAGLSSAESAHINAELWSSMSAIAAGRSESLIDEPVTADEIATQSPQNRLLAAPYLRLHASQWTVDQAAALLLMSPEVARTSGADPSAAIYPLVALESTSSVPVIQRVDLACWPAMGVLGEVAAAHLGYGMSEIDLVDLYSCFPVAVRIQATELGISIDRPLTVTGGMTFGGGPFNNYVLQATASMAGRLRSGPARSGLVTTVSGLLTKPGLAVWSAAAANRPPLVADLADEAARRTQRTTCSLLPEGAAMTIESSTAWRDGEVPTAAIVGRDAEGHRRLALRRDDASFDRFCSTSGIGEQL